MPDDAVPIRIPPPLDLPLAERHGLLDEGKLDPEQYRTALVEHIRRTDPRVRAFVEWRSADVHASAIPHAVSVTYKDCIDVAGYPTRLGITSGYRRYPAQSAYVAERLERHGLVNVGKVAATECSLGRKKPCRNPAYPHVSAAGSSTGSAAAVAAGFCDVSVGSDSGGSLRWPAVYCGVTALRLTPRPELIAGVHAVAPSMESVGLVARDAADLAWLWNDLGLGEALGPSGVHTARPWRIAVGAPPSEPLHPEVRALLDAVARALADTGHELVAADLTEVWATRGPAGELLAREARDSYGPIAHEPGANLGPDTLAALEPGARVGDERYRALLRGQERAREQLAALLHDAADLLIIPLEAGLADRADPVPTTGPCSLAACGDAFPLIASYARSPVAVLPLALSSEQSPLGVQVLAAPGGDGLLVEAAALLARLSETIDSSVRQAVLS